MLVDIYFFELRASFSQFHSVEVSPHFITNTTNTQWLLIFGDESNILHLVPQEGNGLSLIVMGLTLNTDSNKQRVKCDNFSTKSIAPYYRILSNMF